MGLELRILTDEANNTGFTLDVRQDEDFPLALNFGIAEIQDIGKTKSTFSKTFKIPETVENNKNLNSIYYSSTSDDSGVKSTNVAIIIEDGTPISKGYVRIKNVIETERGREYEFNYYGSNFAWIKKFRELSLQDLDFGTDNHTYNDSVVESSWSDGAGNPSDSDDRSYVYPIISYGKFPNDTPNPKDLRPAIFLKSILDKSFEVLLDSTVEQYNINSTFLDGTYFKRLVMPFIGGDFISTSNKDDNEDLLVTNETGQTISYDSNDYVGNVEYPIDITNGIEFDTLVEGNDSATGRPLGQSHYEGNQLYLNNGTHIVSLDTSIIVTAKTITTAQAEGEKIRFITRPSNIPDLEIRVIKYNRSLGTYYVIKKDKFSPAGSGISKDYKVNFELTKDSNEAGDYIEIFFQVLAVIPNENERFLFDFNHSNTILRSTKKLDVVEGHTVNLADTLPDLKLVDYFKGLAHIYNLYVDTNEWTREITIESRDDFFKDNSQAIDWTDKLDLSNGLNINYIDSYNRSIVFQYKEDSSDKLVERYTDSNNIKIGAGEVDLSNRFPQGETLLINPFFSGTIHNRVNLSGNNEAENDKQHIIPCLWNKIGTFGNPSTPTYKFNPRILYYDYSVQTDNDSNTINWVYNGNTKDKIPTGYFTDTVTGSTLNQESLHFEGSNGLVSKYYKGTLGLMNEGVNVTVRFNLTKHDIQKLDLSTPIYLSAPSQIAGYYVIEKVVDYKPSVEGSTKVVLTKIIDTSPVITKSKYKLDIEDFSSDRGSFTSDFQARDRNPFEQANRSSDAWDKYKYDPDLTTERTDRYTDSDGRKYDEDLGLTRDKNKDSFILNNGSGNTSTPFSGNTVIGNGLVGVGVDQTVIGNFNSPSTSDILSVGAGTDDDNRATALSVTNKGTVQIYGGEVYMEDSNGNIVSVMTEVDNKYEKVYLSK